MPGGPSLRVELTNHLSLSSSHSVGQPRVSLWADCPKDESGETHPGSGGFLTPGAASTAAEECGGHSQEVPAALEDSC